MIFVTVGTDLPFDRMMRVIDQWAREDHRDDVFAQIGEGAWEPEFVPFVQFLEPREFNRRFDEASLVISHAGMGTILSALLKAKPILVMPKLALLGEHRNEHQTATARRMSELAGVNVAFDEIELRHLLDDIEALKAPIPIGHSANTGLISALRSFIHDADVLA